ncbi:hypothetical protein P8R33_04215 [Qipengyuania sp. XHP0211]|uniref:hypothetical protein n=1 Tax=Qipengyuania sp. XHP0211 TaxID=3038079 RepID=UPI00241CC61B|nr:hypothetical protein [Qipengyuania sp. XHP0211]MDG5750305.1 hypothetical protein [Qipengyuania sp. XHP0211]
MILIAKHSERYLLAAKLFAANQYPVCEGNLPQLFLFGTPAVPSQSFPSSPLHVHASLAVVISAIKRLDIGLVLGSEKPSFVAIQTLPLFNPRRSVEKRELPSGYLKRLFSSPNA